MYTQRNKRQVRVFIEAVWNAGRLHRIEEFVHPDFVLRDAVTGALHGVEGLRDFIAAYRDAFPDIRLCVEDQIAEGSRVVTQWRSRGLPVADVIGIAPQNRRRMPTGVSIDRFASGKILETWGMWDALDLIGELGAVPDLEEVV